MRFVVQAGPEGAAAGDIQSHEVWVEDPDGSSWEVFVVLVDAPVMKGDHARGAGGFPRRTWEKAR